MSEVRTLFEIDINGKRYRIFPIEDRIVIGSGPGADIIIPINSVSERHLKIKYDHEKSKIKFMDLNSSYGMVANGAHLQTRAYYEYLPTLAINISEDVAINKINVQFISCDLLLTRKKLVENIVEDVRGEDEETSDNVDLESSDNVIEFQKLLDSTQEHQSPTSQQESIKLKAKEEALNIQKTYMRLGQKIVEDANAEAELIYQKAKLKSDMILEAIKVKKEDVARKIKREHDQLLKRNEQERDKLQLHIDQLRNEKSIIQDQNEKIIEEQAQLNQQLFRVNEEISSSRKELSVLNEQKNDIQQNIYNLNREKEIFFDHFEKEKAQRIENLESKVGTLHTQINKINQEKNELEVQSDTLKEKIKQLDTQSQTLSDLVRSRELKLAEEEEKFNNYLAFQQEKTEEYQTNIQRLEDQIQRLSDDINKKIPIKSGLEQEISSLQKEHHELMDSISQTKDEYEDLRLKLAKNHDQLKENLVEELKQKKHTINEEINQLMEEASNQKKQLIDKAHQQADSMISAAKLQIDQMLEIQKKQGQEQLEKIGQKTEDLLQLAREKANTILSQAQMQANNKAEELLKNANVEKQQIIDKSKQQMLELEYETKKDAEKLIQIAKNQSYQLQQDAQTIYLKKMDDLAKDMQEFREKKIHETNELIIQKQQELSPKYQQLLERIDESNKTIKEKEKYSIDLDKKLQENRKELEMVIAKTKIYENKVKEELEEFRTNYLKDSRQQLQDIQSQVKTQSQKYQEDKLALDNLISTARNKEQEIQKRFEQEINHHRQMAIQEIAQMKIKADKDVEMMIKSAKDRNDQMRKLIVKEVSAGVGTVLTVELKSKLNDSGIDLDYQKIVKEVKKIVEFSVLENEDALHDSQFKSLLKLEKKSPWKTKKFLSKLIGIGTPAIVVFVLLVFFPQKIKQWFYVANGEKSAQEKFVEKIKGIRDARPRFNPRMQTNIMPTYTLSIIHTSDFAKIYLDPDFQKRWAQRVDDLFVNRFNKTEEATVKFITIEGRMIRDLQTLREGIIYESQKNETQKLHESELSFLQDIAKIIDSKNLPELNKARTDFFNSWKK